MENAALPHVVKGYLFTEDRSKVCLLRKNGKLSYMSGKLCAPGGKVEPGESFIEAVIREFREETGVHFEEWQKFGAYTNNEGRLIVMFAGFSDVVKEVRTTTDEEVIIRCVRPLPDDLYKIDHWAIPMALDEELMAGTRNLHVTNRSTIHVEAHRSDIR